MAIFPDWIYKFTPRDEQVTPLEFVTFVDDDTQSSAGSWLNSLSYTVPKGKILLVNSVCVRAWPQAAVIVRSNTVHVYPPGSGPGADGVQVWAANLLTPAAGVTTNAGAFTQIMIPEDWQINAQAEFSAGSATNDIFFSMTGVLIPRGNFAV